MEQGNAVGSSMDNLTNYQYYDRQHGSNRERNTIDGRITGCGNCVGYCRFSDHNGFLTKKLQEGHDCVGKACRYYVPKRKSGKKEIETQDRAAEIVRLATEFAAPHECVKIMSAKLNCDGYWVVRYITITNIVPIDVLQERIAAASGERIKMVQTKCDYNYAARIITGVIL